jgi:hypothetical protein
MVQIEQHRREYHAGKDISIPFGPEEQVVYSWETLTAGKRGVRQVCAVPS